VKKKAAVKAKLQPKSGREWGPKSPELVFLGQLFSRRMGEARDRRGLTQQQLADMLGWSRITISRLENNHHAAFWPTR